MGATLFIDESYDVTGTLVPDVTGTYDPLGVYNLKPTYEIQATGWFIWWDGVDSWKISTVVGTEGTDYWTRNNANIVGVYTPGGTATGDATVAVTV